MESNHVLAVFAIAVLLFLGLFGSALLNQALDTAKPQTAAQEAALFSARQ